jgi:signal-transduction protein with cAMP-binding, CBS, and nucleotidyltransferase domain
MALSEADAVQVRSIHLFKSLSEPSLPTLLKSASIKQFPARAELLSEGDRATTLYTLLQGSIELFSEHHDRRSSMAVKHFVLASITGNTNPMSARTLARSDLLHGIFRRESYCLTSIRAWSGASFCSFR